MFKNKSSFVTANIVRLLEKNFTINIRTDLQVSANGVNIEMKLTSFKNSILFLKKIAKNGTNITQHIEELKPNIRKILKYFFSEMESKLIAFSL